MNKQSQIKFNQNAYYHTLAVVISCQPNKFIPPDQLFMNNNPSLDNFITSIQLSLTERKSSFQLNYL